MSWGELGVLLALVGEAPAASPGAAGRGSPATLAVSATATAAASATSVELPPDPLTRAAAEQAGATTDDDAPPPAQLVGFVRGVGSRDGIPGVLVLLRGGGPSVETDADGRFVVDVPAGEHELVFRAPGFEPYETKVILKPKQRLEMEYRLEAELDAPVYRTVVKVQREAAVSSTTLSDREIREVPGTQGDPLRVIQSLPGASQLAGFLPYVVVRGASPGNTGYFLDGARVPILFHLAVGPSVIHPHFIDAVDFFPGGAPVQYGRAVSGMVSGRTHEAKRDRVRGDFELRLTDAGGLLEIPLARRPCPPGTDEDGEPSVDGEGLNGGGAPSWKPAVGFTTRRGQRKKCRKGKARAALTAAGRYSYTGALLSAVQSNAIIKFWDYQARLDHKISPRADLSIFAFGSFDEVGQAPTPAQPELFIEEQPGFIVAFNFHRLISRLRYRGARGSTADFAVTLGRDLTAAGEINTSDWRVAPRMALSGRISKELTYNAGLDVEMQYFRLDESLGDLDLGDAGPEDLGILFSERDVYAVGVYADLVWQHGNIEARPGLRTDVYSQFGTSAYFPNSDAVTGAIGIDPRLLLREKQGDWTLKQSVGVYHQPPSSPIPLPALESFGLERGLQRNVQVSAGYDLKLLGEALTLSQEAYVGRLTNLQDYELAEQGSQGQLDELDDILTSVTGWTYGLESILKLDPTQRVFGWVAYTLSWSTRNFDIGGSVPSAWDQRHIFNAVLGYRIGKKWNFGGRVHYNTGRPWTARGTNQEPEEALAQNRHNARLPPFFQLDLRAERVWNFRVWQLRAFLDVANATYSREVFRCEDGDELGSSLSFAKKAEETVAKGRRIQAAQTGFARCSPLGFRYVLPTLGLQGRF